MGLSQSINSNDINNTDYGNHFIKNIPVLICKNGMNDSGLIILIIVNRGYVPYGLRKVHY